MVESNSNDGGGGVQGDLSSQAAANVSAESGSQQRNSHQSTTGSEVGDSTVAGVNNDRQLLTFEEDLWDQLDRVTAYHKHGSSIVLGLQNFAIGYNKLIKKFAEGLNKYTNEFEKDMFQVMRS